ncbi:MAG: DNA repair protein RecO [Geobacteraceae bacterium GWC2_53_11]|nr:MAG: DNA repair protein RecO [Geobacteraceae bacterium GWC2_53_11]
MQLEKLQAFVLSNSDYGESDRIVSLFTLEHGRLRGFARGARNSRKRFGPALETFARIDVQLSQKDGLSSLRGADVITLYSGIRGELGAIAHALYTCELVECLTPEGVPLPRLYRLLAAYLERLDSGQLDEADRRMFEINLLNILGYRPSLEECSRCGAKYDGHGALLQQDGELVCRFCAATGRKLPLPALQRLGSCLDTSRFGQIPFDEESLAAAACLLDESIAGHASRKLKSLDFLQQICP